MKLDMTLLIALAQIGLSALFLTGYFVVLLLFMLGYARVPPDYKEAFAGLLSLMTGGGLSILYFWFQRQRSGGVPDPGPTPTETPTMTAPSVTVTPTPTPPTADAG